MNRIIRIVKMKPQPIDRIPNMARGSQSRSWWAEAAKPDQREQFIKLAHERYADWTHEQNVKGVKALYTQGRYR